MGKVIFTEEERHIHPQLALNNILDSKMDNIDYRMSGNPDYAITGNDGYIRIEARIAKNSKRGTSYFVATEKSGCSGGYQKIREFKSKAEAEKYAKVYAVENLSKTVLVINQKNDVLGRVYFEHKHYPKKPSLTKKEGRVVLPYFYSQSACRLIFKNNE